ncbi:hypothetical protein DPMN_093728 [Dreissena polymorpha]|uniref:Uncharacterized protein n=1 Tax=Dreissena polymorpha TaxID=45954 RepID=A0A9D4R202_DREPO|nr:hypothetical protein DPMN_093728 [Dreissena polymorpha]
MSRGGSAASFASQSQYSESTVLNQDLGEPDLFVPEHSGFIKAPYPTKVLSFSPCNVYHLLSTTLDAIVCLLYISF